MDPFFGPAVVDRDEPRETPLPHRYVHGSFEGTDTRFSVYLPPADRYDGRVIQFLQGGLGGWEHQAPLLRGVETAFACGAVLVESNQGHLPNDMSGLRGDASILTHRASAASARFAKVLARESYGAEPHHVYVYGGSGGGLRSIACLENVADLYDGAVPFMIGHGATFPFLMSVSAYAAPLISPKIEAIADAVEPGGSGDPFAVLASTEERDALATLYRSGYPRGAEFLFGPTPLWVMAMQTVLRNDPGYASDFWTTDGYAGADGEPGVEDRRIETKAVVERVVRAGDIPGFGSVSDDINLNALLRVAPHAPAGVVLDVHEPARLLGASLRVLTGAACGRELRCTGAVGDVCMAVLDPHTFEGLSPGDEVHVDNRDLVAFSYFHRHLVDPRLAGMRHLCVDGYPVHPQRPYRVAERAWLPSGRFAGRMIALHHAHDRECWPMNADDYAHRVHEAGGDERFRLWWTDNASHFIPARASGRTRLINYLGTVAQAVADLVGWVEDGAEPAPSTPFEIDTWGALRLPEWARGGIQPRVRACANGGARADVARGQNVRLTAEAETPTGSFTSAGWDLEGTGSWTNVAADGNRIRSTLEHAYREPGTYFATFRVAAERAGDPSSVRQVQNLARVRVVVS